MLCKIQGTFVKQYQGTANLLNGKSLKPAKIKGLMLAFLLTIGSTAVLAGCKGDTPSTSESSATSESPATSVSPAAAESPSTSKSPVATNSTKNPNVQKAEAALKGLYTQQTGVPIDSVKCPEDANLKTGGTFECQAQAQGINFGIQVKMENDKGNFDSKTQGLLILTKIEDLIKKTVKEKANLDVTADCGGKLRAAKTGDTFSCQVKDPKGQTKEAKVTVKDEQGNINVKL